jgi:hypothetical protein
MRPLPSDLLGNSVFSFIEQFQLAATCALVCRSWKKTVYQTAQLWTTVCIDESCLGFKSVVFTKGLLRCAAPFLVCLRWKIRRIPLQFFKLESGVFTLLCDRTLFRHLSSMFFFAPTFTVSDWRRKMIEDVLVRLLAQRPDLNLYDCNHRTSRLYSEAVRTFFPRWRVRSASKAAEANSILAPHLAGSGSLPVH